MLAFAPSFKWVFLARIIDGLTAGNISIAQAYISDVAAPKDRPKAWGKISIAFGLGFGSDRGSIPIWLPAAHPLGCAAFIAQLTRNHLSSFERKGSGAGAATATFGDEICVCLLPQTVAPSEILTNLPVLYLVCGLYLWFALYAERQFRIVGQPMNAKQVGYAFAYLGAVGIIMQLFCIGRMIERLGERRTAAVAFASSFVDYGVLCAHPWWILLSVAQQLRQRRSAPFTAEFYRGRRTGPRTRRCHRCDSVAPVLHADCSAACEYGSARGGHPFVLGTASRNDECLRVVPGL